VYLCVYGREIVEFQNKAPFHSLAYNAYNVHDEEHHVVVTKVVYRLVRDGNGDTHRCEILLDDDVCKLVMADVYDSDVNTSSVRTESEIAPFKPRCDVIVRATAYAPGGVAAPRWAARLRVSTPATAHPTDEPDAPRGVLIDKTLTVTGPRWFERANAGYNLTEPTPTTSVPIRWEHAFGGHCVVLDPEAPQGTTKHLLNEVCFTNPLGNGWIESRYCHALEQAKQEIPERMAAPQVEYPNDAVTSLVTCEHPPHAVDAKRMRELAGSYVHTPAGFGCVGRAWTPRLQHGGTYDETWVSQRHPFLPGDFSFAYWNAAPMDQQIAWPGLGARFELTNLGAPEHTSGGVVTFTLPPHRAFVVAVIGGLPVPVRSVLDTVMVDAEAMTVTCLWRVLLSRTLGIAVLEARFETNPEAPLLALEGGQSHG
jgi:hypothetical protein